MAFIVLFLLLLREGGAVSASRRSFLPLDIGMVKRIYRVGMPAMLERLAMSTGQLAYVRIVTTLGMAAYAAHAVTINVESLSYMPGIGFAQAATTLSGINLGAGRPKLAAASVLEATRLGCLLMGFMGLLFFAFPSQLMRIYTDDPAVVSYGVVAMRVVAFAQVPMAISFVLAGGLRGAGDTPFVFYTTLFSMWAVRLSLAYVFVVVLSMGIFGAWLAMAVDWVCRATIVSRRFTSGRWKEIEV